MRVLVTGGAGFIGSHLCARFLDQGHEVLCLDNLSTGRKANIEPLLGHNGFSFEQSDVAAVDYSPLPVCDLVCHFASLASPPRYRSDPFGTMRANALATWHLLSWCKKTKARFLFAGTSEVYGDPVVTPQPESYFGNVNSYGPRSCYDESKRFGETLVFEFNGLGVDTRVARIFNTFGPGMDPSDGRVIPNFIMSALLNRPLTVYGTGQQTRSLLYVSDLVDALMSLATREDLSGTVVNLGGTVELTVSAWRERIATKWGRGASDQLLLNLYLSLLQDRTEPIDRLRQPVVE